MRGRHCEETRRLTVLFWFLLFWGVPPAPPPPWARGTDTICQIGVFAGETVHFLGPRRVIMIFGDFALRFQ